MVVALGTTTRAPAGKVPSKRFPGATRRVRTRCGVAPGKQDGCTASRRDALRLGALLAALSQIGSQAACGKDAATAVAQVEAEANSVLRAATSKEVAAIADGLSVVNKGKAPALLRLVFHDAGTYERSTGRGGSNGSVRFELDRPESRGLKRGLNVVEAVKKRIRAKSKVDLSYADLIVVLGAWAVKACGGPEIEVLLGRRDSSVADAENMIPDENLPVVGIKDAFSRMGLDTRDLVALSGSHALGGKGFGDPLTFDNEYYKTILKKPWLNKKDEMAQMIGIPSDRVLPDDPECRKIVKEFADDEQKFFQQFTESYSKMATLGYKLGGA
ncbi:heme peroxidase [Chloropicon primus]|uniref:L-ascorbate peroxidase n=1 Tax=Chloropicon primus TaxID=1764295 RepID=A0A5B8MBU7_9CHLO|nr:heme peroxidase [Chloropicon primus]UPQ97082.1 heme peroxidase [Chloropicon primus]|eukprot:QDZ17867.1 heme peroxidase [Chloropicon primus]